jgi:hypothetical protein
VPHAYAYLRIWGEDLPLEEISKLLDIEPTESWRKGDPGIYVKARKDSAWCLHSPLPRTNTCLFEHFEALLALLRPRVKEIRELGERFSTSFVCTGSYDGTSSPGLCLSKNDIAFLASAGLDLDADLYFG